MTDRLWVVNASPLVVLAKAGRLDLLLDRSREVLVPEAVGEEVRAGPEGDPARTALETGFGGTPVPATVDASIAEWSLGRGESAVLSLARQRAGTAIIDDRDARRAAAALGVPFLGTVGVVIRARMEQRIPSAASLLNELRAHGFRIDDAILSTALRRLVGEAWKPS